MNMEWRPEYEINVSQHAETENKLSVVIQAPAWTWANWGEILMLISWMLHPCMYFTDDFEFQAYTIILKPLSQTKQ